MIHKQGGGIDSLGWYKEYKAQFVQSPEGGVSYRVYKANVQRRQDGSCITFRR